MQNFIVGILTKVLSDPKVQQMLKNLLSDLITEKIAPLVPLAAASAVKAVIDAVPALAEAGEALGNVVEVAERTRVELNELIPDIDIGIPLIDNLMDVWRPRG